MFLKNKYLTIGCKCFYKRFLLFTGENIYPEIRLIEIWIL